MRIADDGEVLVTSGGKNVSPSVLEDRLRSRPPVGQCMVVGDGRPYVIVEGGFTEENGMFTPSLKVRRHAVAKAHADRIEQLYRR